MKVQLIERDGTTGRYIEAGPVVDLGDLVLELHGTADVLDAFAIVGTIDGVTPGPTAERWGTLAGAAYIVRPANHAGPLYAAEIAGELDAGEGRRLVFRVLDFLDATR